MNERIRKAGIYDMEDVMRHVGHRIRPRQSGQIEGAAPASIDLTGEENSLRKLERPAVEPDAEAEEGVGRG